MRRDSIFYRLFQQSPALVFELLETPPANAADYRFDSVAVKEPKFEIDGVFLPPDTEDAGIVYFCEVQFQKDEQLYERLFSETFLYFYRKRDLYSNWSVVVIYPKRSIEQSDVEPYRVLLNSTQVKRVYLDELGDIQQLPLGLALMVLTTLKEKQAPEEARYLVTRTQEEVTEPAVSSAIIEMIKTIMVYKFTELSRQEVEAMMGISLQDTRVYREAKEEGHQEGRQEGRQEEAVELLLRQLSRRCGQLSQDLQERIASLPLPILESLSEALLDFTELADLEAWLENYHKGDRN
ncbi:MAG: Rpn family recombination-promoting nuclease/putative transposase [Symploca sp. SIO3E6]|nr:Rpn family recombination-promoting nuclease/putative transposase [Caldora sp. SIO3E6]